MIAFEGQNVVASLVLDLPGNVFLGSNRVDCNQRVLQVKGEQVQSVEHLRKSVDLIGFFFDPLLSEYKWASTRRLSLAHALTKWSGALEVPSREVPSREVPSRARVLLSRSAEPRRVFPSRAITPASEEDPEPSFFESSCSIRRPTAAVHRRNRSSKAVGSNREITRRKVSSDGVPFGSRSTNQEIGPATSASTPRRSPCLSILQPQKSLRKSQ